MSFGNGPRKSVICVGHPNGSSSPSLVISQLTWGNGKGPKNGDSALLCAWAMTNTCKKKPDSDPPFCSRHDAPLIPIRPSSDLRPDVHYFVCSASRQVVQDPEGR